MKLPSKSYENTALLAALLHAAYPALHICFVVAWKREKSTAGFTGKVLLSSLASWCYVILPSGNMAGSC